MVNSSSYAFKKLGEACIDQQDYVNGVKHFLNAIKIVEAHDADNHYELGTLQSKIAKAYFDNHDYEESISWYERLLKTYTNFKNMTQQAAIVLGNMASAYDELGLYDKALDHAFKASELNKVITANPSDLANHHWIWAKIYTHIFNTKLALEHLREARCIIEENQPDDRYQLARFDRKKADVLNSLGDYTGAISLYRHILEEQVQSFPERELFRIQTISNIALCLNDQKMYHEALEYSKEVYRYYVETYGDQHQETVLALTNLADNQRDAGDVRSALKNHLKAKEMSDKQPQQLLHKRAQLFNNIGYDYFKLEQYKEAQQWYEKALDMYGDILHADHEDIAIAYLNSADAYHKTKEYAQAHNAYSEYFTRIHKYIEEIFFILDDAQKEKLLQKSRQGFINYFNNAYHYLVLLENQNASLKNIIELKEELFNTWHRRKKVFMDQSVLLSKLLELSEYTHLYTAIKQLKTEQYTLAKLLQNATQEENTQVNLLREKIVVLKHALADDITALNFTLGDDHEVLDTIADSLKKNDVYLDFFNTDKNYYLFVIDHQKNIELAKINTQDKLDIDASVLQLNRNIEKCYDQNEPDSSLRQEAEEILYTLYVLLFKKHLTAYIEDTKKWVISTDGQLNLLPFSALFDGEHYCIEKYQIIYATAVLQEHTLSLHNKKPDITVFADPTYDEISDITSNMDTKLYYCGGKKVELYPSCESLEGVKNEIQNIQAAFLGDISLHIEHEASERNLLALRSPQILHIATHAFVINNRCNDPLLNTALALKGYNTSVQNHYDDGIFTGLKASALHLGNTDLVVLSACKTASGEQSNVLGVSSLSLAFMLAGAKATLVSYWMADDEMTERLFSDFYKALQTDDFSYSEHFHTAQTNLFKYCRENDEIDHPLFWACFAYFGAN